MDDDVELFNCGLKLLVLVFDVILCCCKCRVAWL